MAESNGVSKTPPPVRSTETAPAVAATTISTIAVQSGNTRIVIALLKVCDQLQLRVLECTPPLTRLGACLDEAEQMRSAHFEVLQKIQNKQSPVEELLRQADELIASQKTRAQVYTAMAESLSLAWKDIIDRLDQRKNILNLNVTFQRRVEECQGILLSLQLACTAANTNLARLLETEAECSGEVDSLRHEISHLHDLRRASLESLMAALSEGKILLESLQEMAAAGSLDSRPDTGAAEVNYAISQVEQWLEDLHDRRRVLELTFSSCRTRLEQRLALAMVEAECARLETETHSWRGELARNMHKLGDSSVTALRLAEDHEHSQQRLKEMQDHSLKMTKAAEQLVTSGAPGGSTTVTRTYALLDAANECIQLYEERGTLLQRASKFFVEASDVISKLSHLWSQLTTAPMPLASPETVSLHSRAEVVVQEVSDRLIDEGRAILQVVGEHKPGAEGVKGVVNELENWKMRVEKECVAHKEENLKISQSLNNFLDKQNHLFNWLVNHAEAFLQNHVDMNTALAPARVFQDQHLLLAADLQAKGSEINALLLTLPPILDLLNDEDRRNVDEKVDTLHTHWLNMKALVEGRLLLVAPYVKFHTMAAQLANEMDEFEEAMKLRVGRPEREKDLDLAWTNIQQKYMQLKHVGQNFCADAAKVDDPHLDVEKAVNCVETLLEHLSKRQFNVAETWQEWQLSVITEKEIHLQWERNIMESSRTVDWVSKLDSQLYPVLPDECGSANSIKSHIEDKLKAVLPEIKKAQDEVEGHLRTADTLLAKGEGGEQGQAISDKLRELQHQLQELGSDYQVLLHLLVAYFTSISELEKTIDELKTSQEAEGCTEGRLKGLEASYQAIAELLKFAQTESEQIIVKIKQQEPEAAGQHDIERLRKLLTDKQATLDSIYSTKSSELKQNQQKNAFDRDLAQINYSIADLGRQLEAIRGQYGEDVSSAKATSAAFDYFEKTIQLLEQRIENFITTTRQVQPSDDEEEEAKKAKDLEDLQKTWKEFREKVAENRRLIELSIQYFQLIEEASEWFKEGGHLLTSITRRSTAVRFAESANMLLQEIDTFLKPGETKQDERIEKITELGKEIYGETPSQFQTTVAKENSEMIQSFTSIREELVVLAKVLSQAEAEKSAEESDSAKPDDKPEIKSTETSDVEVSEATTTTMTTTTFRVDSDGKHIIEKVETTTSSKQGEPTVTISETSHSEAERPLESSEGVTSPQITEITSESEEEVAVPPKFVQNLIGASIEEGEKFRFECRVTGVPPPKIIWEKDGMSIENNPDYVTSQENGLCTLTIEETFTEDSAKFTCKAINLAGKAETSATLSVNEAEPEQELSPPSFIVGLPTASTSEGAGHTLECLVKGEPLPTVQWFKDGAPVEDSSERSISYNNGTARLRIEQVSLEDQGEYTCKATNSEGTAASSARLAVEPVKPVEAPTFPVPLSNVMARAGQKIKLECSVKGIPNPTVIWTQDGKPIKETRELKTQFDDGRATLVITEAFPKDAGTYVATARNSAGEAFTSCTVTVKGRLPTETSDSELASDMEPTKPSIQLFLKDTTAKEGDQVRLDCIIVGQPEPEVIWYHEGRPVKESPDFQLLFQGDRCSLILREAYLEDAGRYKVVAINSAGEASSECVLSVEGAGESEPPSRPSTGVAELITDKSETEPEKSEVERSAPEKSDTEAEKTDTEKFLEEERKVEVIIPAKVEEPPKEEISSKEELTPPRFTKLLTDVFVAEGDEILLECTLEGLPKPAVRWTLNNNDVVPSDHVQLKEDNGVIRLRIASASPDDRGVYTARATNPLGEAKCFANLIVKSPLADSRTVELAERLVGPDFKERFVSRSVPVGTTTKFECIVTGRPTPKVRWFFNDEPVSGSSFLVSKSGERDVLTIPEVSLDNIGHVSCIAENEAGKATCSATLTVVDSLAVDEMPQPGGGESTTTVDEQSSGTFSMKRAVFMQSSSSTSTTTTQTGFGPPKTESHSVSSMTEHELKREGSKPSQEVLVERKEEVHKVGEQPAQVLKEGTLVMSSDGEKTKETFSSTTNVPVQPKISTRKSTAPRFVTPLNGKIVDQGADILLEGIIDGYPTPTIEWTKNGQDIRSIPEAARISTSWELNRVRLQIDEVTVKDAGRYSCKATNPVGTATSTADIVVKKTIFPPVFGRRLLVSQCRQGERVTLEVEVTGLPEPTVTWSKDGLPLSAFPQLEIRQRAQGNSYAIIIERATTGHSGRYMVRATNAGGEAQCVQDLAVLDPLPDELQDKASQDRIFQELMDFPSLQKLQSSVSSIKMSKDISSALPSLPTPASATGESLHVTETSKTEKHFSIKVDGTPSPLFRPTGETQSKVTTTKFSLGPEPKETTIPIQREPTITTNYEKKSPLDSFSVLPKVSDLNYETLSKQVTKEETATSKSIHTKIEEEKHFSSSGSAKTTEIITERGTEESQNEAIDSSSIPTQTALQFFMSKIQEQKEPAPPKPSEPKEPIPAQQKVTEKINIFERYEPRAESADENSQPKDEVPIQIPKVTEKISIFENYESKPEARESSSRSEESSWKSFKEGSTFPSFSVPLTTKDERFSQIKSEVQHTRTVHQETRNWSGTYSVPSKPAAATPTPVWMPSKPLYFSEESTGSVFEKHIALPAETTLSRQQEFNLRPEPPPEMCYTPKAERSTKREGLADRVKNLEDSQKQLDPLHIPKGAVRILPVSIGTPGSPKIQTPKAPQPSFLYPAQKEVKEEEIRREVRREEIKTTVQPDENKGKKNAETVGGGTWTTCAAAAAKGPPLPTQTMSACSTSCYEESRWSQHGSETYMQSGGILRPAAQDVAVRPTSPRPSADAVSMEKLWTSHRSTSESDSIPFPHKEPLQSSIESRSSSFSKYERTTKAPASPSPSFGGLGTVRTRVSQRLGAPMGIERPVSPRPSSEGLAMDKMWAHKKTSSVKKVWPPPQPTEDRIIAPWTTQYEKTTTQETGTTQTSSIKQEKIVQEEKNVQERETVKPFLPVEPPKPQGFRPVFPPSRKTEFKPGYCLKPETPPPLQSSYFSTSDLSHKSSMEQLSSQFSKTYEICKTEQSESSWNGTPIPRDPSPPVVEERHIRPSEARKIWPPNKPDYELQAPKMVKKVQRPETHFKPVVAQLPCSEPVPGLEPGTPPEIGYAAPPPQPRRRSYVEQVEKDLEKNLEKGPSRVVPGGVRIIPPKKDLPKPLISPAPKEEPPSWKPAPRPTEPLEPFPFRPEPERPKQKVSVFPPPTPSKFVKGEFVSSDYESDLETTRISAKWRPSRSSYSDTETCSYRRVRPPSTQSARFTASQPEPIPPTRFEQPGSYGHKHGMRHENRISSSIAATQAVFTQRSSPAVAPLNLKPGSPPVFCQKKTPESPRSKKCQRVLIAADSGYMADTDEPRTWKPATPKSKSPSSLWSSQCHSEQKVTTESSSTTRVEQRTTLCQESSFQSMQKTSGTEQVVPPPVKPVSSYKSYRHNDNRMDRKIVSSGSAAFRTDENFITRDRKEFRVQRPASADPLLEPFPFKPDPPRPRRAAGPPPPSPSKFVKGEFRESDYESDYDGRIPPVWRPYDSDTENDRSYRRVRPVLTPVHPRPHARTPTPPTEFDNPPHFTTPPRPKFEPIEKPLAAVKLDEILQPAMKATPVVRPKPIQGKPIETFLVKSVPKETARIDLQPGTPPELGFAPPAKSNQFPAVHETSKSMSFAESTETSRRIVSMQKTTRVYQFGEKEKKKSQDIILEPIPFKPDPPVRSKKRAICPPPPKPSKFVPGEFRESDYESEVESTRIKAKWAPSDSETDEPHYRKVRAPTVKRCSSVPLQSPVPTPDFSTPYMPLPPPVDTQTYSSLTSYELQEQKRLQRVEEMRRRFDDKSESQSFEKQIYRQSKPVRRVSAPSMPDFALVPGSPPEFAFSGKTLSTQAKNVASQHLNQMTHTFKSKAQRFMEDIVTDSRSTMISKKPERPILKKQISAPTQSENDQQAFREETRVAEYGTKHIDPDTGLIYFKYDFGYEFGIILPGEGKITNGKTERRIERSKSKEEGSIDFPVIHEKTGRNTKGFSRTTDDITKSSQYRSKKFHHKSVKWEPTSESEVSELETDSVKKHRHSLPQPLPSYQKEPFITIPNSRDFVTSSPSTLSPSLPSLSPYNIGTARADAALGSGQTWTQPAGKTIWLTPLVQTQPVNANSEELPPKPPSFITPLRDIAVVNGQTARFECIVQAEPGPNIIWAKDGRILEHCQRVSIQYRNGVCRLTIAGATSRDAGSYTCTATNRLGTTSCTAALLVPGERRASLGAYRF